MQENYLELPRWDQFKKPKEIREMKGEKITNSDRTYWSRYYIRLKNTCVLRKLILMSLISLSSTLSDFYNFISSSCTLVF